MTNSVGPEARMRLVEVLAVVAMAIALVVGVWPLSDAVTTPVFRYADSTTTAQDGMASSLEADAAGDGPNGLRLASRYAYDPHANLALTSAPPAAGFFAPQTAGALDDVVGAQQVTVLGRYKGGTEALIGKPGFNVLDLPSKGTGRWYWSRNRAFIDDAVARGDELRLVTNPFEPIYSGGNTFQRELRYLKDLGYRFEQSGDSWVAVPGR